MFISNSIFEISCSFLVFFFHLFILVYLPTCSSLCHFKKTLSLIYLILPLSFLLFPLRFFMALASIIHSSLQRQALGGLIKLEQERRTKSDCRGLREMHKSGNNGNRDESLLETCLIQIDICNWENIYIFIYCEIAILLEKHAFWTSD